MAELGPTQGAERHTESVERWTSHPWLARILRALIMVLPMVASFGFSIMAGRVAPADELGMNRWLWIATVFALATLLLVVLRRLAERLVPLVALMKLTLVFPDNAPSRTRSALRNSNSRKMLRDMEDARARGETTGAALHGDYLVQLLKEVNEHDRLTRGHSERVRAYSELLGVELGLKDADLDKLRWAALLHDVGKLTVPGEILNKDGRPTDEEWQVLSQHPSAGLPMLEPLRPWLGDWIHAADQHHCRWDGTGYPNDLAGTDITEAGRLVAIADAFDVMTSARSYKKPLAPEVARQELTDCAGSQFDPVMVRAFLQIGLGRLKTVAGPIAWLGNLTGSAQLPVPAANVVSTGVWSAGVAATGMVTMAANGVFAPTPEPQPLALDDVVVAQDVEVAATAGDAIEVVLTARGEALVFNVGGGAEGSVTLSGFPERVGDYDNVWSVTALYEPGDGPYVGQDGFSFEVCDPDGDCDQGVVTLNLAPPPTTTTTAAPTTTTSTTAPTTTTAAPTTSAGPTTTAAPTSLATTSAPPTTVPPNLPPTAVIDRVSIGEDGAATVDVVANDTDPDGDSLLLVGVGAPLHGTAVVDAGSVRYTPEADYVGDDQFVYTVSDGTNAGVVGTVEVTVTPVNDPPVVIAPNATIAEAAAIGSVVATVSVADVDDAAFVFTLSGDPTNRFDIDTAGVITLVAALDHESTPVHNLVVSVSDGDVAVTDTFAVTVIDVDEPPMVQPDSGNTAEDTPVAIDIGANDADPEGLALTWILASASMNGGSLTELNGTVTYTPPADFFGTDLFVYQADDPAGNRSPSVAVTVTVGAVNDAPVAVADAGVGFSTLEDTSFTTGVVTANDSDVDDPVVPGSIVVTNDVDFGTLTDNGDGTFGYVPDPDTNGNDTFQYTITDAGGATSAPATVTIAVTPVNDPPTATDDALTVDQGGSATTVDLRLNDNDPEGSVLTIVAMTDGAAGTVADNADGTLTYTHNGSATLTDSFTYTVSDPGGLQATATVVVTVNPLDFDGVGAGDNCPATYNPDQTDTDGDGKGDACDPIPTDPASPGVFALPGFNMGNSNSVAVAAGDLDGDGDTDLVFANDGNDNSFWRNFSGLLFDSGQSLGSQQTRGVALGDMDGDGSLDLVFANSGSAGNEVWLNDGSASFTSVGQFGSSNSEDVAVGDVDGDGDLDAVFANRGDENRLWLNNGSGVLTDSGLLMGSENTMGVELADLNGDAFLDLLFTNDGPDDTVWFNNGSGVFTDSGQSLGVGTSHGSAIADIDNDGDRDLVITGDSDGDTIWLNNGSGVFTDSGPRIGLGDSRAVDVGDIDGDGDLDIAFGNRSGANSVWLNNGSGVFNDSGQRLGNNKTEGIVLADTDGDGDLDLFAANDSDQNWAYGNF